MPAPPQISHDVLLRAWPRLRGWLEDDQASLIFHGQLASDAAEWHSHNDDPSFLYRGTQLAALREATSPVVSRPRALPSLTDTQANFLQASEGAAARGTHQRRFSLPPWSSCFIGSVVSAGIAAVAARSANQQRAAAVSGQLAAESEALDTADPVTASLLAAAAWRIDPTPQARDSMLDVLAQPDHGVLSGSLGGGPVSAVAFSSQWQDARRSGCGRQGIAVGHGHPPQTQNPAWRIQRSGLGSVQAQRQNLGPSRSGRLRSTVGCVHTRPDWQTSHRRQWLFLLRGPGSRQDSVAFSRDRKVLATVSENGTARLWDVATRHQVGASLGGVPAGFRRWRSVPTARSSPQGTSTARQNCGTSPPTLGSALLLWQARVG